MGLDLKKMKQIGPYQVDSLVNNGGMAWVLKVRNNGRVHALKLSLLGRGDDNDELNRTAIREEAQLLSELDHFSIVKVYPIERDRGKAPIFYGRVIHDQKDYWYFVMEYLSGGSLEEYLKKVGPLTVSEATNIVGNVCMGLYYLHSHDLVHMDIKAENIVFRNPVTRGEPFQPVLVDFGTAAGFKNYVEMAGSPLTMPPERIRIARGLDAPETKINARKAEVWSIGVILYQSLTGKSPFSSSNIKTLTSQILQDMPTSMRKHNRDIPEELDRFVTQECLCKDAEARPALRDILTSLRPYGSGDVLALKSAPVKS